MDIQPPLFPLSPHCPKVLQPRPSLVWGEFFAGGCAFDGAGAGRGHAAVEVGGDEDREALQEHKAARPSGQPELRSQHCHQQYWKQTGDIVTSTANSQYCH